MINHEMCSRHIEYFKGTVTSISTLSSHSILLNREACHIVILIVSEFLPTIP